MGMLKAHRVDTVWNGRGTGHVNRRWLGWVIAPVVAVGAMAGSASAQTLHSKGPIRDTEPQNNMQSTADVIPLRDRGCVTGVCSIRPGANDIDWFRVSLLTGDVLMAATAPVSSLPDAFVLPDTTMRIYNSAGTELLSNFDAGTDEPAFDFPFHRAGSGVRFRAAVGGDYFVQVRGVGTSGPGEYFLVVARGTPGSNPDWSVFLNNDTPALGYVMPLATTGPLLGLDSTNDKDPDHLAIDMNAGDVLVAMTAPVGNLPTDWSTPDTTLDILDPDGVTVLVTSLFDAATELPATPGGTRGSLVRFRASTSGRHYVRTIGATAASGSYFLATALLPAQPCPGDANGTRDVTFNDITAVLTNFGAVCP